MSDVGKINIDFQVLKTYDPKTLLIADTSDWKHIENKPSVIKITMPGGSKPCEKYFDKRKINIFNSSILGITPKACTIDELKDLPDGIYTIELIGSPDYFNKQRYYLRTERTQLEIDKLYLSLGIDFTSEKMEFREMIYDIDFLIKASEAAIRLGDVSKSSLYFKEAKNLLSTYSNCIGCN